jgi:hypothetical protein
MKKRLAYGAALLVVCIALATYVRAGQQDKSKRPSPPAKATVDLGGGATVTVDYSSPKVKGRKIFGGLVPYGKVWRTGANEATTFVTTADITVGGKAVPAGSYTLFTVPGEDKWTLALSKTTGEWGTAYPGEDQDLARIDMKVSKLPALSEDFKISFEKSGMGAEMNVDWENTRASVGIAKK